MPKKKFKYIGNYLDKTLVVYLNYINVVTVWVHFEERKQTTTQA